MKTTLSIGYSPCPNDTRIFHALASGLVGGPETGFRVRLEDVETLNSLALKGALDVTKISYGAVPAVLGRYCVLRAGGALGRGCGPLIVAREPLSVEALKGRTIAIPGEQTTAYLLMRLREPGLGGRAKAMPFDRIMHAVSSGEADAGLIIHESRFTYREHGLVEVEDLGRWWEGETGLPIPLGCIVARRSLGPETIHRVDALVRASLEYAISHPEAASAYIREHATEMDEGVMQAHIALYVNEYSLDLGDEGVRAVEALFAMARARGLVSGGEGLPLFA